MIKIKARFVYIFLLLILCAFSFVGGYSFLYYKTHNKKSFKEISSVVTLNAQPIKPEDVIVKYNYVGYTEAINQVQIIPYINGYLENVAVEPGQMVQQGDLLINIEPFEYKAKLDAAKATVLKAKALFDYNKNYYNRIKNSGKKAFSENDIDNAKNNLLQAEASFKNAKALEEIASINYGYTKITAPISGLLGNFSLTPGDYVTPSGTSLLYIVQTNPIRVVFSITDKEYLNMHEAGTLFKDSVISILLSNGKYFPNKGTFKYTDNQIKKATNSLSVYAHFQNPNNDLLPNSFVTVEISKTFKNAVSINKNLINMQNNGNFLTIARHNKLQTIPVEILSEKDNMYVLRNIFQSGDLLILDKTDKLSDQAHFVFNIIKS